MTGISGERWLRPAALLSAVLLVMAPVLAGAPGPVQFKNVTQSAGIAFSQTNGAFGKKYFPEQYGSGVLVLDVDSDGWQDLLFVNGKSWPERPGRGSHAALYRNLGNGSFADISKGSGLDVELYGVGGAAADYDNDGRVDVFLTALEGGRLFHGDGRGRFRDVTRTAGVSDDGWSTSAMWVDVNRDGWLDLFVARYVQWNPELETWCAQTGRTRSYCSPQLFDATSPKLYLSRRDGTFTDVSERAGVSGRVSKGLGVAMLDYDGNGWMDLFIANDLVPNQLLRNRGDGTFEDVAGRAGVAVSELGVARAGMGTDAADYDGSGWPSLVIGNFSTEMMGLYHNDGKGLFIDEAPRSEVGRRSMRSLTFGCFFFDYDLDGWLDIFAANGHVQDDIRDINGGVMYRQAPHLFRNVGAGRFVDALEQVGPDMSTPVVGRGAASLDFDNDGDLDVVITQTGGPARLFRNDGGNTNHAVRVRTEGIASNRQGVGARVDIMTPGGRKAWALVKTGSSFASQSQTAVTFGLGTEPRAVDVRVTWPNGRTEAVGQVEAGFEVVVTEGKGITARLPFRQNPLPGRGGRRQ